MKKNSVFITMLVLLIIVFLNGCGGGGSSNPNPQTISINSTASLDGQVSGQSDHNLFGPTLQASELTQPTIFVGARHPVYGSDDALISRGLVSFDLSGLAGRTIINAVLKVHIASVTPNSPFDATNGLGSLQVDHFTTNYTATTSGETLFFDNNTISTLVSGAMTDELGWRVIAVTNEVIADLAAGRNSQYRLHFQNELNVSMQEKMITIETGENTNNKPVLVVTYQ